MHLVSVLFFLVIVSATMACDIALPCKKCLDKKCFFVISKEHKSYCVSDLSLLEPAKQIYTNPKLCRAVDNIVKSKF